MASGKSDRKHLSSDDSKAYDRNTFSRYDDKGESAVRLEAGHDGMLQGNIRVRRS